MFTSRYREELPDGQALVDNFVDAFLAYCPNGTFAGDVVYVNYGTVDDFAILTDDGSEYQTDLSDKICMARYGAVSWQSFYFKLTTVNLV